MDDYISKKLKKTTIENYINSFYRFSPYIGSMKLKDVRPANILYTIDALKEEGFALSTIETTISLAYMLFDSAATQIGLKENPCKDIRINKNPDFVPKKIEPEEAVLPPVAWEKFWEACRDKRYYELYRILYGTGMRIGEACALEWEDVDFDEGFIHVYKTINNPFFYYDSNGKQLEKRQRHIQITTPKKEASNRLIPISENVREAFLSWKEKQEADKEKKGDTWGKGNSMLQDYPGLVFTTASGGCVLQSNIWADCTRLVNIINKHEALSAAAENRQPSFLELNPHAFRHAFVTNCVQAGMTLAAVKKISGHRHASMTEHYTHIEKRFLVEEFSKLTQKTEQKEDGDRQQGNTRTT